MVFWKNEHSVQFRVFSIHPKLNIFTYLECTQRDDHNGGWPVAGNRRTRPHALHAPPRFTARQIHAPGASDSRAWRVRSTRQLLQRIADVIDDVILPSQQRAVSGADVSMTWLLTRLLTRQMTSANDRCSADVAAHVAMTWLATWLLTSA